VFDSDALNEVEVGIAIWDAVDKLSWANTAYRDFYGLPEHLMEEGAPILEHLRHFASIGLYGDRSPEEQVKLEHARFLNRADKMLLDYRLPDGRVMEMRHAPLAKGGKVILHTDVSGFRAYERTLAENDPITGLPSAEAGERMAQSLIDGSEGSGSEGLGLRLRILRLGQYESAFGIGFTNRLIKRFVKKIEALLDKDAVFFRAGGSEFGIFSLTRDAHNLGVSLSKAILEALKLPIILKQGGSPHSITLSVSLGMSRYPKDGTTLGDLWRKNRQIMLEAISEGENQARFYTGKLDAKFARRAKENLQLAEDMRRALRQGEFFLKYQPQVQASNHRLLGCEALMRWEHPDLGDVSPDRFIPIAEEVGLIGELGKKALVDACTQAMAWRDSGLPDMVLCVNVSRLQAQDPAFSKTVEDALQISGLPAANLELELTESVLAENLITVSKNLEQIRALGIRLAIDDFGTGYSSLAQLADLPFDRLKIDKRFVEQIGSGQDALVRAVILIAQSLDMEVVAEGVETEADVSALVAMGCDQMQGYYFSKPLPADQFLNFCQERF